LATVRAAEDTATSLTKPKGLPPSSDDDEEDEEEGDGAPTVF
jgi:hypothetical protein